MSALVRLNCVSKVYRMGAQDVSALRGVSIELRRGEMVAIMGSSGSGKSTALNIIGTLDRPTTGTYELDGVPVHDLSEVALAKIRNDKIGFVFQQFHLLARDTALENVELPLIYARVGRSLRRERAEAALRRVGLGERMGHTPTQLSGGQQQRVSIARAIVNEPLLLLADEPTGALDSATTRQVMELFCELHTQGITVILVTHDPLIAGYADRVVEFKDGSIVADATNPAATRHGAGTSNAVRVAS